MRLILTILICFFSFITLGQKTPKLIVGIVIDQMRFDYLQKFGPNFSNNGFNRIMKKGTNCTNVYYNYVPTYTGPGHASIYTGTTPKNHGIIANDWFNRVNQRMINCVEDNSVSTVGSSSNEGKFSPKNLISTTITDEVKLNNPHSKTISISIKNRGAILPGGHLSDGSYWYDYSTGKFITSSFYTSKLPSWVKSFNEYKNASSYLKDWDLLLKPNQYRSVDSSSYEILIQNKKAPCFPYNFSQMLNKNEIFALSPFANTLLTDLAIESINQEQLGKDLSTDFLCISYSSTDIAGHLFGTDSREVEDMYYRLDLDLARLMKFLDHKIGKNNYCMFLTADHAAVPVPQSLIDKGLPGGYLFINDKLSQLNQIIADKFDVSDTIIKRMVNNQIYFDLELMKKNKIKLEDLNNIVVSEVKKWDGIKEVYTKKNIEKIQGNQIASMIKNGYLEERSGDIVFNLKHGYLIKSQDLGNARRGTSHGSPYNYDTHVPLLWYGLNIPNKTIRNNYSITQIVPTLTQMLNIQTSGLSEGMPILEIFE